MTNWWEVRSSWWCKQYANLDGKVFRITEGQSNAMCLNADDADNPQLTYQHYCLGFLGLRSPDWSPSQTQIQLCNHPWGGRYLDLFLVWKGIDSTWGLIVDQTHREHILGITSRWPHITPPLIWHPLVHLAIESMYVAVDHNSQWSPRMLGLLW